MRKTGDIVGADEIADIHSMDFTEDNQRLITLYDLKDGRTGVKVTCLTDPDRFPLIRVVD